MKKIFEILMILVTLSSTSFAMTFQQPIEIGWIGISQRNGAGGFMFKNETSNNGSYYTGYDKNNKYSYGKGIVCYGNDDNALYVHYNAYEKSKPVLMGDKKESNTVPVWIFNSWIYKITSNEGIKIFAIGEFYGPDREFTIIGTKKDGTFVKYIDTRILTEKYFGVKVDGGASPIVYKDITANGDTISITYSNARGSSGEFRFKWDEKAQWFGIEQVVY